MRRKASLFAGLGLAFCTLFLSANAGACKTARAKNGLFLELLGNGLVYSLNYERAITPALRARIGLSYDILHLLIATDEPDDDRFNMMPLILSYLFGSGVHKFEVGAGAGLVFNKGDFDDVGIFDSETRLVAMAALAYRLQTKEKGPFLRLAFTPFFGKEGWMPWGGISLGLSW